MQHLCSCGLEPKHPTNLPPIQHDSLQNPVDTQFKVEIRQSPLVSVSPNCTVSRRGILVWTLALLRDMQTGCKAIADPSFNHASPHI